MLDFELSLKGIIVEDLNSSRQISRAYAAVEWLKTDPKSRWRAGRLGPPPHPPTLGAGAI